MRNVSGQMWYTWEQGKFLGPDRPITRATISKTTLEMVGEQYRSLLFGVNEATEHEIPNIRTCAIDRRLGTDAAQMTLTFLNSGLVDVEENLDESYIAEAGGDANSGPTKRELMEFGSPGGFSYRRGVATSGDGSPNPWAHSPDPTWVDMFLPNRVIKTFQGYGTDNAGYPWNDAKLVQTGVWLVDKVEMSADGLITVTCRDPAKLLIEQRLYPPIIPLTSYPLDLCGSYTVTTDEEVVTEYPAVLESIGDNVARQSTRRYDSSTAYYSISTYGHRTSHAFDGDETTFWASMRNKYPNRDWSYEWIDAYCGKEPIKRVRFKPWAGGYTCYVGVKVNGVWQGTATVPYNRYAFPSAPNDSDIKYVKKINVPRNENWVTVDFDEPYNAEYVRLVFTDLADFSGISGRSDGDTRAGVREFQAMAYVAPRDAYSEVTGTEEVITEEAGNITDYTDIIKLFLAWSGFYWPKGRNDQNSEVVAIPQDSDPLFLMDEWGGEGGRVWGDFMDSGAYPVDPACIPADYWDNKSVQDGINQIKEILGFIGYVDATGGFVWRPPNIWKTGNFVTGIGYQGETSVPVITEENVLLDFGVTVDDAALRSEIVVVQKDPDPEGSMIWGSFVPNWAGEGIPSTSENGQDIGAISDVSLLAGQVRTMLVADYPFGQGLDDDEKARAEVDKFAYLVALWIHWTYRKTKFRVPGMPALEPDDQVRIFERITSETYIHYLLGVNSVMDMDAGTYYMDIDTHWLGNGPDSEWHVQKSDMSPALFAYLLDAGLIDADDGDGDGSTYPTDYWKYTPPTPPKDLPRVADDYEWLFPDLPDVIWPDWDWDPATGGSGVVEEPVPPSTTGPGSAGSVLNCSPSHMVKFWPGSGPNGPFAVPPNCGGSYMSRYRFYGSGGSGSHAVVDRRAWVAFRAMCEIFESEGYQVQMASGFNCRYIANTRTWSNHAWGLAVDINYPSLGRRRTTNSTLLRAARRIQDIRAMGSSGRFNVPVFKWGQYFGNPDPAHWQVCCAPEDIARGLQIPGLWSPV